MNLTPGQLAAIACMWEVTARKPGNVHRVANLPNLEFSDFLTSAIAIAPILNKAPYDLLGQSILEAVKATRTVVRTNTNLGLILLLTPLASIPYDEDLSRALEDRLSRTNVDDSANVFAAIRLAEPGGLGKSDREDVWLRPTLPLRKIMAISANLDLIAKQYVNGFREVLGEGNVWLTEGLNIGGLEEAIVYTHLHFMAAFPDSLIQRKLGREKAEEAARRAKEVLDAGWPETDRSQLLFGALDVWLRADGNRRNPGTSADMVAATLYVALREGVIPLPLSIPWSAGFIS